MVRVEYGCMCVCEGPAVSCQSAALLTAAMFMTSCRSEQLVISSLIIDRVSPQSEKAWRTWRWCPAGAGARAAPAVPWLGTEGSEWLVALASLRAGDAAEAPMVKSSVLMGSCTCEYTAHQHTAHSMHHTQKGDQTHRG